MNSRSLMDLKPGESGRIAGVRSKGYLRRRILEMGMTIGSEVELERYAPLGDPIEIKIKGCHLSLRREEAESILLES